MREYREFRKISDGGGRKAGDLEYLGNGEKHTAPYICANSTGGRNKAIAIIAHIYSTPLLIAKTWFYTNAKYYHAGPLYYRTFY